MIGGHNISDACVKNPQTCGEANLDVQYMMAVSPGAPMTYVGRVNIRVEVKRAGC